MYVLGLPKCSAHNSSLATSPRNRIGATEGDLKPCFLTFFGVSVESHFISELRWNSVILPMVLQIGETMVLQGVELEGKGSPPHFWIFGSPAALMRKHGFAEKLHQK